MGWLKTREEELEVNIWGGGEGGKGEAVGDRFYTTSK